MGRVGFSHLLDEGVALTGDDNVAKHQIMAAKDGGVGVQRRVNNVRGNHQVVELVVDLEAAHRDRYPATGDQLVGTGQRPLYRLGLHTPSNSVIEHLSDRLGQCSSVEADSQHGRGDGQQHDHDAQEGDHPGEAESVELSLVLTRLYVNLARARRGARNPLLPGLGTTRRSPR